MLAMPVVVSKVTASPCFPPPSLFVPPLTIPMRVLCLFQVLVLSLTDLNWIELGLFARALFFGLFGVVRSGSELFLILTLLVLHHHHVYRTTTTCTRSLFPLVAFTATLFEYPLLTLISPPPAHRSRACLTSVQVLCGPVVPRIKSYLSKSVDPDQSNDLFAALAGIDALRYTIGMPLSSPYLGPYLGPYLIGIDALR